jgi:hypothetical protein
VTERDDRGRFVKGQTGNPNGRPKKAREEQYLDILLSVVTPEEWTKVCVSALTHAKAGDGKAREWLGNYIIGKPVERHEVTFGNGDIDAAIEAELARLAASRKTENAGTAARACNCCDVAG